MSATHLKKITAEAKRIRARSPRTTWQNALKAAGKKMRGSVKKKAAPKRKRVGATLLIEKRETSRTKPKRVVRVKRSSAGRYVSGFSAGYGNTNVSGSIAGIKKATAEKIGKLEAKKFQAKKVTDKRKIAKKIAEAKKLYRKLS